MTAPRSIQFKGQTGTLFENGGRPVYLFNDVVQLSPEWWELRQGVPTASEANRLITPKKAEASKAQRGYLAKLIGETESLDPPIMTDRPGNPAMRHGRETEAEARSWYALERGVDVTQTGFAITNVGPADGPPQWQYRIGSSPDGVILESEDGPGGLELKCPQPETHAEYLMDAADDPKNPLPSDYRPQVHFHLIVLDVQWVDFMSYARGFPPLLVRVRPDAYTAALKTYLGSFLDEYKRRLDALRGEPATAS